MDALQPDSGAPEGSPKPPERAVPSSNRAVEYCVAAALAALALAISPVAIRLLTGRAELTFRPLLLSITFDLFLLLVAGAVLARGHLRRFFFHLIPWSLPFVLFAGLEVVAGALHLSDRVSLLQDFSTIKRGSNWGPGMSHLAPEKDGFVVYRPWAGNGVTINELGLRTALPIPRSAGQHHIAVVGSSETWGFRLADADTIPALLQAALRRDGNDGVTVYNFGVEDATLTRELALLRHFKNIYDIDRVVFVAGASDVYREYFDIAGPPLDSTPAGRRIASFELYKTIARIRATWFEPSPDRLARFDASYSALPAEKNNRLADGILAANNYCATAALQCDFVLQPLIEIRWPPAGTEAKMAQAYRRLYPRREVLAAKMYRDALDLGAANRIHDLSAVFDHSPEQFFVDAVHLNEAGNMAVVDALLPIVRPPGK